MQFIFIVIALLFGLAIIGGFGRIIIRAMTTTVDKSTLTEQELKLYNADRAITKGFFVVVLVVCLIAFLPKSETELTKERLAKEMLELERKEADYNKRCAELELSRSIAAESPKIESAEAVETPESKELTKLLDSMRTQEDTEEPKYLEDSQLEGH